MSEETAAVERDRQMILQAQAKGTLAKLRGYSALSVPGWLRVASTLAGGSLAV